MSNKVTILIDADPLVYRVGFSLETRVWYLEWVDVDPAHENDPVWDDVHIAKFYNAAARDRFIELMNLHPDEYAAQLVSVPTGDEAIVYGRVKQTLRDIEQHVALHLAKYGQEVGDVKLYLTGKNNFRDAIATIWEYKGNRDRTLRPYWYDEIRAYLINRWGALVIDGMEADDAVSIAQWQADEGATVIATIDKDLENVPGHNYNYHSKQARYITHPEARLFFYRQILTGDASDNIPGCKKIGPGAAAKLLPSEGWSAADMWCQCVDVYRENMEKYPEHHHPHTDPVAAATENARLLWMLTYEGETWSPPE